MQDNEVALHDTLLLIDSWTEGEKSYISTIYLMREKQCFFSHEESVSTTTLKQGGSVQTQSKKKIIIIIIDPLQYRVTSGISTTLSKTLYIWIRI